MEYSSIKFEKAQLEELESILKGLGYESGVEWNDLFKESSPYWGLDDSFWIITNELGKYEIHNHNGVGFPARYTFEEFKKKHNGVH